MEGIQKIPGASISTKIMPELIDGSQLLAIKNVKMFSRILH
jgi:hypothetical protein